MGRIVKLTESELHELVREAVSILVNENIENEYRDEITNDENEEVIVLDNFKEIEDLLDFPFPEAVYFVQIIQRHADNRDMHFANHKCDYLNYYLIHSLDELHEKEDEIKSICKKFNARAYIHLNPRHEGRTTQYAKDRFHWSERDPNNHGIEIAYGMAKDKGYPYRKICHIDLDSNEVENYNKVMDKLNELGIQPLKIYRSSTNGWHFILPDKERIRNVDWTNVIDYGVSYKQGKNLDWGTASTEYDKPVILYSYLRKPKDENGNYLDPAEVKYKKQKEMQAKIRKQKGIRIKGLDY